MRRTVGGQPSAVTTWQIYGFDGELLAEYAANASAATAQKEYGYRNGQLLITSEAPVNVPLTANGASSSASSVYGSQATANVNNGERKGLNFGWWTDNSSDGYPDWVEVDFAGAKTINEIDVIGLQEPWSSPVEPTLELTARYALTNFEMQYWTGSAWVAIPGGSVSGNDKVWRKFSFDSLTTSKIRVYVTNVAGDNHTQVVELEAWTAVSGSTANVNWLVTDQLGTPRMVFDRTGSLAATKRHDYLPFGEELFATQGAARTTTQGYPTSPSSSAGVRPKFTQKERDNETGLDYFLARYYSNAQGRFTSPDEFTGGPDGLFDFAEAASANPTFYADLGNPQSLNKYQYSQESACRGPGWSISPKKRPYDFS